MATGARKFALGYIAPLMYGMPRILDVCSGDRWVKREFGYTHGDQYIALDLKDGYDVTKSEDLNPAGVDFPPDLIISIYGLQHLLGEEARVWTLLRRIAKPETKFVYVGRWRENYGREMNRQDPLNAHNLESIGALAFASGWKIATWAGGWYDGDRWGGSALSRVAVPEPNVFGVTLEPLP